MGGQSQRDWTGGPAKWAAVAVLGGASLTGIVWSIAAGPRRESNESLVVQQAKPSPAPAAEPASSSRDGAEPRAPGTARAAKIDLNSASLAELEALPGVGPELAKRVIEFRETRGLFTTVEQLDNVKGIGPKLMERIRPLVKVESPG